MNKKLQDLIDQSKNIVIFTGAGISTLSGIPDFHSNDNMKTFGDPVKLSNINYLNSNPKKFYDFFQKRLEIMKDKEPNKVHKWIKELEDIGKLSMLITQNIDNLHQQTNINNIITLHGNAFEYYCMKCKEKYDKWDKVHCNCGGLIKPNVILFGEKLNQDDITLAMKVIQDSDLLIVIGTSLLVSPANIICTLQNKGKKVLINRDKTPYDYSFDMIINEELNDIFN